MLNSYFGYRTSTAADENEPAYFCFACAFAALASRLFNCCAS